MTEPKFTPPPWEPPHFSRPDSGCNCTSIVEGTYAGGIGCIYVSNGIKSISEGGNDCPPVEEARANGFLIAAAPELYEALAHCVEVFKSMADRGAYPLELLPDDPSKLPPDDANPHFLGKQGFVFAVKALAKARGMVLAPECIE